MKNPYLRFIGKASAFGMVAALSVGITPFSFRVAANDDASVSRSAKVAAVTDPQIAAIVVAANTVDIEAGKLAQSKAKDKKVKEFANNMVRDHTAVNQAAVALVTKLGVTPEENDTSRGLIASGVKAREDLSKLKGKAFDKAYIDNEVAYHRLVLNAVDNTLIPDAQNAELKATLVKYRPAFAQHLQHAEELQAAMSGKKMDKKMSMSSSHSMR
jgi:putative membrane protein